MGVYKFLKCVTVLGFQMIMNVIVNEYLICEEKINVSESHVKVEGTHFCW